jgi:hypothetical protein
VVRKKKPVDRTPICDPAYLRRIDPVWMPGPVPPRFWEGGTHRRDYLLWSARRLGFLRFEDLYRLNVLACYERNHGRGLQDYWGRSALEAVEDCFPEYDWKPWLFTSVPDGFWDSAANRRCFMDWLGQHLGYRCSDDWYQVTIRDFARNGGSGLMDHYHYSPPQAVMDLIPGRNWCEWKFRQVPDGFWEAAQNRRRYMRWLGKELRFRRPEDWYRIQIKDFVSRRGSSLLRRYTSLYDLLREFLPKLDWDRCDTRRPIRAEDVLAWADAHHARHGKWPSCDSGKIPETGQTWGAIQQGLLFGHRGLPSGTTLAKFLAKHRGVRLGRTPPSLSEKQVLAWADAHFAAMGKWPTEGSGPIPGTRETWCAVAGALRHGGRGFRRRSSLAQLLAQRRGVRNSGRLPPLTEQQILAWASAFFQTTGRWPYRESGPIAQSPGDTWSAADQALRVGVRGLPGGSSLAKLLRRHGLK